MLSRVADNLYWMSRYLERAEHTARVAGVQLNLMLEHDTDAAERGWRRALSALGLKEPEGDLLANAQKHLLGEIVETIACARENARQVREQISSEMWEELNRLFHESKRIGPPELFNGQPYEVLFTVLQSAALFQGVTDSTMVHGEGWQFIQAGRFIQRVQHTARLIDAHFDEFFNIASEVANASEHMEWIGLLRSCTAFEAYCKVYTAELRPERVAEFLLLNPVFPHSVRYGVSELRRALDGIHEVAATRKSERLAKLAGRLTAALSYTPLEEIMSNMQDFLANIRRMCGQIHTGVYQIYITYPIESALEA